LLLQVGYNYRESRCNQKETMAEQAAHIEVTRELLQKYDRPGPRYTSYPTAPEWSEEFSEGDYRLALARAAEEKDLPLSLYFHLPFCHERCLFCGCNVVISKRQDIAEDYLKYVYRELEMVAEALGDRRGVKQVHWGGGTPTYLTPPQIEQLHAETQRHFQIAPDAEVALEVDPRVTTKEQLETLRRIGFNRISMGVQDTNEEVQQAIKRCQSEAQTRQLVEWSRELGFGGVNMDLIFGLPLQTPETWEATVKASIDIRPDRLAVYSYAHLPSKIKHQRRIDHLPRATGAEKYDLFAIARRLFLDAGYRAIGMDHFALPTDELSIALDERRLHRNFMGYSVVPSPDQIGIGVSAIGEVGGAYAQNEKRPVMYMKAIDEGNFATLCGIHLTPDDKIRRWLIRQLMCNFYLDMNELERRFGVKYDDYFATEESDLAEFYAEGFLVREGDTLRVLPLGQIFIRNISMVFDAFLRRPEHFKEFSRTV
jgi:oxygen-independent coproporphyrinogen-3 oxidase